VGDKVHISFSLSLIITVYLITKLILAPFSAFINGFGKLKLSLYLLIFQMIIYIPLAFFLGEKLKAEGIILSMTILNLSSLFQEPLQVIKLVNKKAYGIWNR